MLAWVSAMAVILEFVAFVLAVVIVEAMGW